MVHIEHRLLRILYVDSKPGFQKLAFTNEICQSSGVFVECSRGADGQVHIPIELANLALERKRSKSLMLTPTNDMPMHHFAGARNEFAGRILLRQLPCSFDALNDVCIADVGIEVMNPIIKSD